MRAGFGSATIAVEPPVRLAGFGARTQPATSIHDELEACAVWLSSEDVRLCLVACDLLGMTHDFATPARDAIAQSLNVSRAAVLTACTHTHSAPSALRGSDALGWAVPERFDKAVRDACLAAATAACQDARDVSLEFVRARLPHGLSVNRRGHSYEPWFSVLAARDERGALDGVLANIAIHPVTLGPGWLEVSADWPGAFRAVMLARGVRAIVLNGALGDVNPWPAGSAALERYPRTRALAVALADAVTAALEDARPAGDTLAVLSQRTIEVPIAGAPLARLSDYGDTMPVELVEWAIGDLRLVSVPGEAFHAFGREVEDARRGPVILAGLAPVWQGYLPVPFGDGYEEGVSFGEPAVTAILRALTHPDG